METNDPVCNDMMSKLKESFSLKSFSSKSYQTSLICNSKTIRLDVNLIDGGVLTSTKAFSGSKLISKCSENMSKKNEEVASGHDQNLKNPVGKNESVDSSSSINTFPQSERTEELSNTGNSLISSTGNSLISSTGNSPRSSTKDAKLKLKVPVKHSFQAKSRSSFNPAQTKDKKNCSKFKSLRCDVCMKYFSSERNVKRHSVLHSLERHPCDTCGKVFQTTENLKRHFRAIHEVKIKSFKCSKCFKAYSRRSALNIHLKKHPDHMQQSPSTMESTSVDLLLNQND